MKSIMDIKKEEQQRDFLKLSPIERLRTMHDLFLQFVALKAAMPWLDINQERSHAYMGYVGMAKLMEEIDKALYNPLQV